MKTSKLITLALLLVSTLSAAPLVINSQTETDYFLPEDGAIAKQALLSAINRGAEIWIDAYAFDDAEMLKALTVQDAAGVPIHVLLDHLQSLGPTEKPLLAAFLKAVHHADVTITSAGIGSAKPSEIWHWKAVVVRARSGFFLCWEGSVNFSESGWNQGNSARAFASADWGKAFIAQQAVHKAWAREKHPDWQIQK